MRDCPPFSNQSTPPLGDGPLLATLTWIAATLVALGSSLGVIFVGMVVAFLNGGTPGRIAATLSGYWITLTMMVVTQLAILGVVFGAWALTRASFLARLGLVAPRVTPLQGGILLLAGGVPDALSLAAASLPPSIVDGSGIESLWNELPLAPAILWILVIGLFPGTVEELLYRGFIQRGYMRRLSPPLAILLTSTLFGLMHVDPPAIALAFILGLWFGVLAWRTGSILLPILSHILINSAWNAGQFIVRQTSPSDEVVQILLGVIGLGSLVAFAMAIPILRRAGATATTAV